mmetsp:Transcript_125744/g.228181  ORF Transcript_125744/g.228181 Transcript_125744/m.228181 type:complete len:1192 (-) Transcript_125744:46-3621(-)
MKASEGSDGAVSVVVRVRPPLPAEVPYDLCTRVAGRRVFFNASPPQGRGPRPKSGEQPRGKMIECEYDQVLDMNGSQEDVWRAVAPKVEKVLEGYNATIFTYGMTGSGKTFTMLGPTLMSVAWQERSPSYHDLLQCKHKGLVPRAVEMLFERIDKWGGDDSSICLKMSYLHVYRERCYDLLQPATSSQPLRVREEGASRQGNATSSVYVEGLTEATLNSAEECLQKLLYGSSNIAFRSTAYNEQSSRSHCILTLTLTQTMSMTGLVRHSKLHLVDLAGNERWDTFGPEMSQSHAREMTSINQSLHVLGNCMQVLSQPPAVSKKDGHPVKAHVPYRNSTLTMLLRESLSGNSFTVMLCTICACSLYQVQSLCTLRFADRAKRVKMRAKVNDSVDSEVLLKQSQAEVAYLRSLVAEGGASEELQQRVDQLEGENKNLKEQLQRVSAERWVTRPSMVGGGTQVASGTVRVSSQGENRPLLARLRRSNSEPALLSMDPWFGTEHAADVARHLSATSASGILHGNRADGRRAMPPAATTSPGPFRRRHDQSMIAHAKQPAVTEAPRRQPVLPPPPLPEHSTFGAASPSPRNISKRARQLARRLEVENQDLRSRISTLIGLPEPAEKNDTTDLEEQETESVDEEPPRLPGWAHSTAYCAQAACCPRGHSLECLGTRKQPIGTARYHDWCCDAGCGGGSSATPDRERFHCWQCQFDLCDSCVRTAVEDLAEAKGSGNSRSPRGGPAPVDGAQGRGTVQPPPGRSGPGVHASRASAHSQPPRPRPTPRGEAGQRHQVMATAAYASPMPAAPSAQLPQRRPSRPGRSLSERQKLPVPTDSERNRQRTLMEFYRQKVTAPAEAAALLGNPRDAKPLTTVAVGSRALRQELGHQKPTPRSKLPPARSRREPSASPSRHRAAQAPSLTAHSSKESLGVMRSRSEGPVRSAGSAASTAPSSPGGSPRATEDRGAAALMLTYARPSANAELKLPAISAAAACEAAAAEAATVGRQQHQSPAPRRREKELRPALGAPLSPLGASTAPRAQAGAGASNASPEALARRAKEVQSAVACAAMTPVPPKQLLAVPARIGIDGLLPKLEHGAEAEQTPAKATEQTAATAVGAVAGAEVASSPVPAADASAPPPPPTGPSPAAQSFTRRPPPPPALFGGAGKVSSIGALLGEIDARRELESLGLKRVVVPCS